MSNDPLLGSLPDLVVLVRRDGTVIAHGGGGGVPDLRPGAESAGQRLEQVWSPTVATPIKQLVRRALSVRSTVEARFEYHGHGYEARVSAQGPDRGLLVVRAALGPDPASVPESTLDATDEQPRPQLDRRGFLRRFRESVSVAALREKPIAVAIVQLDGITDIAHTLASRVAEQALSSAILRLPGQSDESPEPHWYLGQIGDAMLAFVFESGDREAIEPAVARLCASLREPLSVGDTVFHLAPYAGVAILGQDATAPKVLLEHARSAASEARRKSSTQVYFFSDTLSLRSLARLDLARELNEAIANRDVRLRYVGRHDLTTGRLVAWVGYIRWVHPLRGEIRPVDFLRVAQTTGLGMTLSRSILGQLAEDYAVLKERSDGDFRISFGPLQHHILHDEFIADMERFLALQAVPATQLEVRLAEKTAVARAPADFNRLREHGVQLVVDEVGRGMSSIDWLARAPIWGLQLDRNWTLALNGDPIAHKVCRAGVALTAALGLTPIASGVDDSQQREALVAVGCRLGTGDLYI